MAHYNLNINGKQKELDVDPTTPLLWVLRDHLNLVGTKYGCGIAQCGACTIHVGTVATRACTFPVSAVGNQEITTIEGLGTRDNLDPVQESFIEEQGFQCGFCTPGMVMSTAALLKENPKPSEREVREYLEGNICRCTGYHNIVKAIMAASGQDVSAIAAE